MLQTIDKTKPISIIHGIFFNKLTFTIIVKFPAGIYMDVTEIQVTNIEKNLKAILLKDHDPNMLLSNKNTYSIKHNLRIDENLVNLNNILTKLVNSN